MSSNFKTNPLQLESLLKDCATGIIQLPDFQRSWVWDDDRIRSLIASVSRAFPIGALMTLETGGPVDFKPRAIEGVAVNGEVKPSHLLLDGQQRMTSLYQTAVRKEVVETVTARQVKVKRWYYIDMRKALDPEIDREDTVVGVPEGKMIKSNFGKNIELDLSASFTPRSWQRRRPADRRNRPRRLPFHPPRCPRPAEGRRFQRLL